MRRTGFTLLEATVSLAIVGTVALGALEAFGAEARAALRARQAAPAVAMASEQVARLQLLDAHTLLSLPDSLRHGRAEGDAQPYEWSASVGRVTDELDLYDLRVEVRWPAGVYELTARAYRPAGERAR